MILIILRQVIIMFILAGIGFIMFRAKKISNEGSKTIGNILIYLSLPCVIIRGFLVEYSPERVRGLEISALLALLVLLLSMLIARLCCRKHAIDNFAGSFSNPGFFGIPIIAATFGSDAVFYVAAFVAFLNLLQWTYGVWLLKNSGSDGLLVKREKTGAGNAEEAVKKTLLQLIKAPFMIAILIGLFFLFTQIKMPQIISSSIDFIADINTPLAMFTIGIYAAQTDLARMFLKKRLYLVTAVKLVIIPLIAMLLLKVIPVSNTVMKDCILIAAACPVGSNIAVYAQLYDKDYKYAVETVVISTIFSIATIPGIMALSNIIPAIFT